MAYSSPQAVLARVVDILQDEPGVRWSAAELVMWLNEGMLATATLRPDATARRVTVTLTGGVYYLLDDLLPLEAPRTLRFMRLIRNVAPDSRLMVIRQGSMSAMDAIQPDWRTVVAGLNVLNFFTDPEDVHGFYVFPPARVPDATATPPVTPAQVELMYSAQPVPIDEPDEDMTWHDVTGVLSTDERFDAGLVDFVLSRAFSKDAEYGANGQRAAMHFGNYQQALGYEAQGNVATKSSQKAPA